MAARRSLLHRRARESAQLLPAGALHALREGAMRDGLPGPRHGPFSPRASTRWSINRCIGTRTCSSYCPYKVRRFNWYDYRTPRIAGACRCIIPTSPCARAASWKNAPIARSASNGARRGRQGNRPLRRGEVVTACQAACPTKAIVFGALNDPQSEVPGAARAAATTCCWKSSARGRAPPISRAGMTRSFSRPRSFPGKTCP